MTRIIEYDTVRVVTLHGSAESHLALSDCLRPPAVGDEGTVVSYTEPYDPHDPRTRFVVESNEGGPGMVWLAEFSRDELELVCRPGGVESSVPALSGAEEVLVRLRQRWLTSAAPDDIHRRYVETRDVLPLASDMGGFYGVTTTGVIMGFDDWDGNDAGRVVTDTYATHIALFRGAARYPELRAFLPARPPDARTCDSCEGTGRVGDAPEHLQDMLVCYCGGAGWLPASVRQAPRFAAPRRKRWWQFWRS